MTGTVPEASGRRERLRFVAFDFDRLPNSRCRAQVALEWGPGRRFHGSCDGLGSEAGQLQCAARATVEAIELAVEGRARFELLGVKAVRAFDAHVIIVSLAAHGQQDQRLIGSFLTDEDAPRGAAMAVLNATNRLLGNIFLRDL